MTTQKKCSPALRFVGFTDDWEQRKLGEISENFDNLRVPVAENLRKEGKTAYFGANGIQGFIDGFTHDGEFVLIAEDGANDLKNYPVQYVTGKIWVNNHAHVLQGIPLVLNNLFLTYRIKSMDISKYLVGGGRAKLNASTMKEINICFPNVSEQTQIGNFFKQLDETIALHKRKLKKQQNSKKFYLEKMFPKENSLFPEIRFPNFTDAWEQRKLGDIAKFLNGRAYKQEELLSKGKYPVLRVGNFNTNSHWYYSNLELHEKFYAKKGDLLYTWATIFEPYIWEKETVIYHYHIWKIDLSPNLNPLFTLQLLKSDNSLSSNTNGSTMIHITKLEIENQIVNIPKLKEQTQIGNFFKQLDETIALHKRMIEKLEKIKQAYLKRMFI
ncbi:hypothetical protein B0186_09705 [Canicola haemoglobinophilus]|uniref:Type I restriction/modification specificity protein n=1 Tax=Canicola haemoglobinophilus TaxID=733 RepID=A0A1V4AZ56_9PAST|nr:restriction endonuclease subunit S [Canicola haemoglobinophilus]OOR98213.1 hypothetical protein B0186_09705 [Canicola haemoglobinophilus]STO58974.1 type I restriction/modification specificity protein [Canicola haemoglobinophilus]